MLIPLTDIGKLREIAIKHYKRKVIMQRAILKYVGVKDKDIT